MGLPEIGKSGVGSVTGAADPYLCGMSTINLRSLYRDLEALPRYIPASNSLTEERAQEIAKLFGDDLQDLQREFKDANEAGSRRLAHPDTRGNGLGQFHSAERLFFGYVYELHREAADDSAALAMRTEFD